MKIFREMSILSPNSLKVFETVMFCKFKCTRGRELYRSRAAMNLPSLAGVKFLNLPGYIRLEENLNKFRNRLVSSDFLLKGDFYRWLS
jgi:hypothetical protein